MVLLLVVVGWLSFFWLNCNCNCGSPLLHTNSHFFHKTFYKLGLSHTTWKGIPWASYTVNTTYLFIPFKILAIMPVESAVETKMELVQEVFTSKNREIFPKFSVAEQLFSSQCSDSSCGLEKPSEWSKFGCVVFHTFTLY